MGRQLQGVPVYSFEEAFEMIQVLDYEGLLLIDELIMEDKHCYEPAQLETLVILTDLFKNIVLSELCN